MTLSEIWIYPIKSLRGVNLSQAQALEKGLQFDRRMMLVDHHNQFISQRQYAKLVLFKTRIQEEQLLVEFEGDSITIPLTPEQTAIEECKVWRSNVEVFEVSKNTSKWFSGKMGFECRLVFFPESNQRNIEEPYLQQISLADAFPVLTIGQTSLDDLNGRLATPLPMGWFRPNLVFTGGIAYEEDTWMKFKIGAALFQATRPSYRCIVTTTDQETGQREREPLLTLSKYRKEGDKIYFGMNTVVTFPGSIEVGDKIARV